jgi:hypothetical protein
MRGGRLAAADESYVMDAFDRQTRGCQDVSGWGLAGLTAGIIAGFLIAYYGLIPLFPRIETTGMLTLMTALVVTAMTLGGAVGYLATRRKTRPRPHGG